MFEKECCHPERSGAEPKDPDTKITTHVNETRRSLDSLRSLGMTTLPVQFTVFNQLTKADNLYTGLPSC